MEDFLQNTIKDCGTFKATQVKQSAQEAYDLLCSQNSLLRTPSHELRASCFKPIKGCLESKKSKLLSLGLSGLAKIIRDERFQAGSEPEDDSLWLPSQLLHATSSMLTQCDDTQVHILRCILSMACASSWALNGRLVMLLVGRCGEAYECGTQPVRAAAQAAASQTLTAFCTFLDEECQEILQQQAKHRNSGSSAEMVYNKTSAVACFNEAIPVMQYICSKLEEMKIIPKSNDVIVFLLECLLTLAGALPPSVHSNTHFTTFLWQRFCPALLALLGAPGDPNDPGLSTHQAKIVYSIGIQVVRLVGRERALRPVLEALFHRMLLLPAPSKRLEPLRAAKELLRSPGRLADLLLLTGPIYRHAGDDMAIIRLIMDSIEESAACSDVGVLLASVECVCALLGSLEAMCATGEGMDAEAAEVANGRYITLDQADYTGPLTYQSLARLPKPYRDVVANLKYESDSEDSSGIEGGARDADDGEESDASGATEGPEEYDAGGDDDDEDDSIMDDESFLTNQQLQKLHNIPKSLHLGRTGIDECNTDMERHNARHFVKTLQNILLPNLLTLRSSIQIDEVLQEFASKCCEHNSAQAYDMVTPIVNADGIYLATYAALLLNLRLLRKGHYRNQDYPQGTEAGQGDTEATTIIMTEAQFVDEIHGSGVLVYVSATWLCELYQNVLAKSLLEIAGYDAKNTQQPALISLLTDVGGLCPSQQLTDWQKLQRVHQGQAETSPEADAGVKLARRVLTCCWQSVVAVLSAGLGEPTPATTAIGAGATSSIGRLVARRGRHKMKQRLRDDVITASLEGLQKAASLSNTLKLQTRSSSILGLLSSSACSQAPSLPAATSGPKLLAAHALSLDVLLSKGLDLAVHSQQCWAHVFAACVAVSALEHALFSRTGAAQLLMVTAQSKQKQNQVTSTTYNTSSNGPDDKLDKNCLEEETVDVYSFLQTNNPFYNCNILQGGNSNSVHSSTETTVAEIVERSGVLNTSRGSGLLVGVHAAKVCCVLSSKADELFHNASQRLSLPALLKFLTELCKASHLQLFSTHSSLSVLAQSNSNYGFLGTRRPWWRRTSKEPSHKPPVSLLLFRISEVTLKCIRSGRPLIHTMKIWSIVGPHFMEAACHKDREVSKKAIAAIHDVITCVLNDQSELPHFHFNEALFKPFENLLCLEICDQDVLDQIVASLCEFVEANSSEINSGWRPLFATLRSTASTWGPTQATQALPMGVSAGNAILDIFYIFLQTDNTLVFANAALDYILCLLAHVKVAATLGNADADDLFERPQDMLGRRKADVSMSQECLKLIESCSKILAAMYTMPKCPRFNLTHRMSIETAPQIVDTCLPNDNTQNCATMLCTEDAGSNSNSILKAGQVSYKLLSLEEDLKAQISLREMDAKKGSNGLLKVWYILLEGLTANLHLASPNGSVQGAQGGQAEMLFKILKSILPIRNFAFYCVNHLLLPTMQIWLRRNVKAMTTIPVTEPTSPNIRTNAIKNQNSESIWIHFKHCIGMTVELVVEYLTASANNSMERVDVTSQLKSGGSCVDLALKQLLILLIEIVSTEEEGVARLGVSCVRHLLLVLGHKLTSRQWEILTLAIHRACTVTLGPLTQLSKAFKAHSDSFYGDLATVKVAARKANDNLPKVYELGNQVFLMTSQRNTNYYAQQHLENRSTFAQTQSSNAPQGKISQNFVKLHQGQSMNAPTVANAVKTYQNASPTASTEEGSASPTDDRSYVFLLYPMDMAAVTSPDLFTLRVPFKNLVVGLLAHQLLMQTISSALLQNLRHVSPILQILHVTSNLGGTLRRVDARHIYLMLKCLEVTNERSKQFDLRPGLKFLVQKVGNLPRAANLYTLANTSEVVQIIVLVELALDGIDKYHLTSGEIKKLLDMEVEHKEGRLYTDLDYVEEFLRQLRRKWEALCESYARLTFAGDDDEREERDPQEGDLDDHEKEEGCKRRSSLSSSDSCASYLEKDVLPDYHPRDDAWEDKTLTSTDDETNEMAAKIKKPTVAPLPPAATPPKLSYDTNTLLQMTLRHQSSQFLSAPFITSQISSSTLTKSILDGKPKRTNPFDMQAAANALPPPQPVPPEIQQQRSHSIEEDFEAFRQTRIETMEASLELLSSLSAQKLVPLAAILKDGAVVLAQTGTTKEDKVKRTAEDVLKRMNLQFDV